MAASTHTSVLLDVERATLPLWDWGRVADQLDTICGQANSAAIERPVRNNSTPRDGHGLMLGTGFLALRAQVDVAEEFGNRVRA